MGVPIILYWFGQDGLRFMNTLSNEEEKCRTGMVLFEVLNEKLKHHFSEAILSLQYYN